MEPRKWALVTGVLLIGVISGNLAQSSGRSAKVLEDPTIPQTRTSHEFSLQDPSNRAMSRSAGNNMMMYRTVFAISLKLLTLFLIFKLLGGTFSIGAQHGPMGQFQQGSGWPAMQGQGWPAMQAGQGWQAMQGGSGEQGGGQGGYGSGGNGNQNQATSFVTATSTGAAAGASTGGAAGVVGLAQGVPQGGYINSAGNSPRPSFLYPSFPRFRFGGLRLPPPRHAFPPQYMMGQQPGAVHNMGTETQVIDTHSHMYVLPDGTHARIPGPPQGGATPIKSVVSSSNSDSSSTSQQNSDTEAKSSSSDTVAESRPVETIVSTSSSSSSSSPQVAERRSSLAYREKLSQLQQAYEDWSLHFNPGTRSL